jgi:hypothetical protein
VKHFSKMKSLKGLTLGTIVVLAPSVSGLTTKIAKPSVDDILERSLPGNEVEYLTTSNAFSTALGGVGIAGGKARVLSCEGDYFKQLWSPI